MKVVSNTEEKVAQKYYVVGINTKRSGDEWVYCSTEDVDEAIDEARRIYRGYSRQEIEGGSDIEIRLHEADIEDEDCTNFDYDTVEWKLRTYDVTIKVEGRYIARVEASSIDEARKLGMDEFNFANLNEMEVVDGEEIIVEEDDEIVWER